ncbi:MAG: glyoxalase [Bacteroidetes bacterium]|nr:MAG: glyoxalase [Bacteroidota bacterium]
MARITHFEIPSDNPEKSMEFYKNSFGWTFHKFGDFDYWMAMSGPEGAPGINGAVMKKLDPKQPMVNSINVPDIDAAIKAVTDNGGTIVVPKRAIPGVGWLAYFTDPDQHIMGIMMDDRSAR